MSIPREVIPGDENVDAAPRRRPAGILMRSQSRRARHRPAQSERLGDAAKQAARVAAYKHLRMKIAAA